MISNQNNKYFQQSFRVVKDSTAELRELVQNQLKGAAIAMVRGLLIEEMATLCGGRFSRKGAELCHRAGSDPGSVILQGQRVKIKKPRAKRGGKDIELSTYGALQGYDLLSEKVSAMMLEGVSTRAYGRLLDEVEDGLGLSKSTVSRAFLRGSKQALEEINNRDLTAYDFISIMVDGIELGGRCVIAALGITDKGKKLLIGLREGDTENWEVCRDLFQALIARGLKTQFPILFVTDGSKALKKAIRKVFDERYPIQRCIRHKERNILGYLSHGYHMEFRRRWKKLHGCADYSTAKRAYAQLVEWLGHINHSALNSLEEAEMETLTVIKLGVPRLLRLTLLSTNPIESAFSVVKPKANRVKNWKSGTDQISRWAAATLLEAEKRFRLIKGHKDIPLLVNTLKNLQLANQVEVA